MSKTFLGPRPSEEQVKRLLMVDLEDYLGEALDPDLILPDEIHDELKAIIGELQQLWCEVKGHEMVPDQCGIPEHDSCIMCES